ncbi:hypothetical protein QPK87_25285 [Kamptonema cortianum]|nr:hypothetical protein [Kamptonema cortianum]
MTQTQSNYADLFSTDDRIRINALKAIAPHKTPFEIVERFAKANPKWNPTQAQLVTAIHGVTQLVMWLQEAERRFPHFDLVIHYKFDEFQNLRGVAYFKPKLGAPYVCDEVEFFWDTFVDHYHGDGVQIELETAFDFAQSETNPEVFRTQKYTQQDLDTWGCRESLTHSSLRECLREMGGKF